MMGKVMTDKAGWVAVLDGREAALLHLTDHRGEALRIDRFERPASLAVELPDPQRWRQLIEQAPSIAADHTLVAVLPDEQVYYHRLTLPRTDDAATLTKMVQAQAQVILPLPPSQLAWGWCPTADDRTPTSQSVLVFAVRRELVEGLSGSRSLTMVIPAAVALGCGVTCAIDVEEPQRVVKVNERSTTVLLVDRGGTAWASVLDIGGGAWGPTGAANGVVDGEALASWATQVDHMLTKGAHEVGLGSLQSPVVLCGAGGVQEPACEALRRIVVGGVRLLSAAQLSQDMPAMPVDHAVVALGAATVAGRTRCASVNLIKASPNRQKATHRVSRPVLAVAAWLVIAGASLFVVDYRRGSALSRAVEELRQAAAIDGGIEQRLKVGAYLQKRSMPPLAVISEVSDVAPASMILTEWDYENDGQMRLSGQAENAGDVDHLLAKLAESSLFTQVELRRANVADRKWSFQVQASVQPVFRGYAVAHRRPDQDPRQEEQAADEPSPPAASQAQGSSPAPKEGRR
jgi:Tfp pilus assembly protein PilN